MSRIKKVTNYHIPAALSLLIVGVVFVYAFAFLVISAQPVHGQSIGGSVVFVGNCTRDPGPVTTCLASCPQCGALAGCDLMNEVVIAGPTGGTFCPLKVFPYVTGSGPRIGGLVLGLGQLLGPFLPNTGTN